MEKTKEFRIFGPPGCGKTTTLSRLLIEACQSYGSENVLAASFTRTAARELVRRDLPINEEQIGTLHALCYRALDRPKLVSPALLKDWNAEHPSRPFGGIGTDLDEPFGEQEGAGLGDQYLSELNMLRGLQRPEESWPLRIQSFADDWNDFKANTGTVDFTDLIDHCHKQRIPIPHSAAVFFLDEVQDFSPLELSLARQWGESCERFYMAGDDDQTLYQFKGATPDAFLNPPLPDDQVMVLEQSYRVPVAVHEAACRWVEGMTERFPKVYRPRAFPGEVGVVDITYKYPLPIQDQLEEWLEAGKSVAFLAACSFLLDPIKHQLREWGLPFHNPYRKTRGDWNPLTSRAGTVSASDRLLAFRRVADKGEFWTYADLWKWASTLEADPTFHRGAKTAMRRKAEDDQTAGATVSVEDLESWFAEESTADAASAGDIGWLRQRTLKTYEKPMSYACNVLESRGSKALTTKPQILLGTVHSVKGGEADVVVLFPDLSPSGYREWATPGAAQDSVRRCFYVGMTRAKESLFWAQPVGASIGGYL